MTTGPSPPLARVAAHGLSERNGEPLAPAPLTPATFDALLRQAIDERLGGLLLRAVDDGALPATSEQRGDLLATQQAVLGLDLRLERHLLHVASALRDAGVELRVLKGPAVAHLDYEDPALRSFGDIDLLVQGRQFDHAVALLTADGVARRRYREPRPGFDARFGKGVCIEHASGFEVDLHRAFVAGPFGVMMRPDELFATESSFPVGGALLPALDADARLVHACFHAALGARTPRLAVLRDVAEMLLGPAAEVDTPAVLARVDRWRCGIVVQRAVLAAWTELDLAPEPELVRWARERVAPRAEQRALRWYLGRGRSYAGQALAGAGAVPGIRSKAAYIRALFLPDRQYLHERERSYVRRAARGARLLSRRHRSPPRRPGQW